MRQAKNLSQGVLGKLIEKDGQYISKLERGILPGMTVETLERLADALGCTTDELLGRTKHEVARPGGGEAGEVARVDRVTAATAARG